MLCCRLISGLWWIQLGFKQVWMHFNQHIGRNTSVELERHYAQGDTPTSWKCYIKSCHPSHLNPISSSLGTPSTLNLLRGQSGRKFVMTIRWPGWCLGQRTSRAPSSTSCWTLAPGSRCSHNFTLQPHCQSCLNPEPYQSFNSSPVNKLYVFMCM